MRPGTDATFRIACSDCAIERQGFNAFAALDMFAKYAVVTAILVLPAVLGADGLRSGDSETPPQRLPYSIRKTSPCKALEAVCEVDLCVTAPADAPEGSFMELRAVSLLGTRLEPRELPVRVRAVAGVCGATLAMTALVFV